MCTILLLFVPTILGQETGELEKFNLRARSLAVDLGREILVTGDSAVKRFASYEQLSEIVDSEAFENSLQWESLGPDGFISGDIGDQNVNRLGRANVLAFHPEDPRVLYVGTPSSSLWKGTWSQDYSELQWARVVPVSEIQEEPSLLAISGIAIDRLDPQIIYVLTGDGIGGAAGLPALPSFGVMKSTDGGESWSRTGLGKAFLEGKVFPYWGFKLVMDPCNPLVLLAATSQGIFRTADGGGAWKKVQGGFFRDIEFKPKNCKKPAKCGKPRTCRKPKNCDKIYAASLENIFSSDDNGKTWQESNINLPPFPPKTTGIQSFIELAVTPLEPSYVYAVAGTNDRGLIGFFRSTDSGQTYELQSSAPNILGNDFQGDGPGSLAFFGGALAVSPIDANDIFLGRMNTWRSLDGGQTWCLTSYWRADNFFEPEKPPPLQKAILHADVHFLKFRKREIDGDERYDLYATTDGGVYVAQNGPCQWPVCRLPWEDVSHGLLLTQSFAACGVPQDPSFIYLGNQDNGTYRLGGSSQCHGQTLPEKYGCSVANGDGGQCLIHPKPPHIAYITKQNGRIFKTEDQGQTTRSVAPPTTSNARSIQYILPIAMDPDDPDTLYACYNDVWRTEDGGQAWRNLSNGALGDQVCSAVVTAHGVLYVGKRSDPADKIPSRVWWTEDGGKVWKSEVIFAKDDRANITDIAIAPGSPDRAWVSFGTGNNGLGLGVASLDIRTGLKTLDHNLDPSINGSDINVLRVDALVAVDAVENRERLFMGTQIGVFYGECIDNQCCWTPAMNYPLLITDLEILREGISRGDGKKDPENLRLLAASYGQGAWQVKDVLRKLRSPSCFWTK